MKKQFLLKPSNPLLASIILMMYLGFVPTQSALAQCNNTSPFGSATINTAGATVTISTCSYAGEYSTISGAVNGQTLRFTSSVSTDWITIRSGSSGGPLLAFGQTPLVFANTFTGTVYAHWNTDSSCGVQSTCRTTTVQCTSCVPPPPTPCTNTSAFGTATIPTNGTQVTISTCSYAGEYSTISGAVNGQTLRFTSSVATDNITVRSGTPSGPVLAFGTTPLVFANTFTGTVYAHWNTPGCGIENTCRTTTVQCTNCPLPPDPCLSIVTLACGTTVSPSSIGNGAWAPTANCGFSTPGQEKVYSFTPTVSGVHTLTITATNSVYVDYFFKAVSGGCSSTGWTCIGDVFSPGSRTFGPLTAGIAYYILFDPETTLTATQTFRIDCPPANDNCSGAVALACGTTINGTTVGATVDAVPACTASSEKGVWYTFVGNGNSTTISTCPGASFDTKISVYTGSCAAPVCVGGNDNFCGLQSQFTFTAVNGTTYFVLVHGVAGAVGTFTLQRSCVGSLPPNGSATVACPALATQPTPPAFQDPNCNVPITPTGPVITNNPNPLVCNGTRTYSWTYTDCLLNQYFWSFTYTVVRQPFTVPANGAATVACPALATQPTPPAVNSNCGEPITPTGPVITNNPNPLACQGTRTYTWTYMDCAGNTQNWSYVYTVVRLPFNVPANTTSQVACPALIVQPTPPAVQSNCGEPITPTGPVIVNNPNPITCEGTRTYTWTYTDCAGNVKTWSHTTSVVRLPFGVPANGGATVACPDQTDTQPTPPVVTSNCGEVLTPVITSTAKPGCEGNRNWNFTYTDCKGNTATWVFVYMVKYLDYAVPASETATVECPLNVVVPTPPVVKDNCGKTLTPTGPVITGTNNAGGCEASRKYTWTYQDCKGNTKTWSKTFNFGYTADFFVYPDGEDFVGCLLYVFPPVPPTIYGICGEELTVTGPTITGSVDNCSGTRKYTYIYSDCGGHTRPWSYTYHAGDNEPPVGNCGGSAFNNVNVTNLKCIEDVPCPNNYDFSSKIQQLITAGNIYDVCSGDNITVELDSWSALWQCSDPDGDGTYTFGRTFYFRIADPCGNEMPSLCGITYSGVCQPLETFLQGDWGNEGNEPGVSTPTGLTDLQTITTLLGQGPLTIGGNSRSLTLTSAQCVLNLVPGVGSPTILGNCIQTNCNGCNPAGTIGMKNSLATNTISLMLNMRFNVQYHGLTMTNIRNQGLSCINIDSNIKTCTEGGDCKLRVFESNGTVHQFPYTIGGLLDLSNLYLNGDLALTSGSSVVYANAINNSITNVNAYWYNGQTTTTCDQSAGAAITADSQTNKVLPSGKPKTSNNEGVSVAPNPASSEVTFKLSERTESTEVTFEMYNSIGQMVLRQDFGLVSYVDQRIDIGGIGSGLYIIVVKAGNQRFEQKLVVSK